MPGHNIVVYRGLLHLGARHCCCWLLSAVSYAACRVVELTGDVAPDMQAVARADVIVTTPEKWDGISRSWQTRSYVKAVTLLVIDEIHLLGMFDFIVMAGMQQLTCYVLM